MLNQYVQRAGRIAALAVAIALVCFGVTGSAAAQTCGPMDVVFVIDNTGSMGGVIDQIQTQVGVIADTVAAASGNDYQFGLIALPENDVVVLTTLKPGNRADLDAAVDKMVTAGSCGNPASWDEGLNTAIHGLGPRQGANGEQIGDFPAAWRGNATKIIIVITDTHPSGFDCDFDAGVHDALVSQLGEDAAAAGILVTSVYVPTGNTPEAEIVAILQDPATTSGGFFMETEPDASNTADIIVEIIKNCGGGARSGPTNLFIEPTELVLLNEETGTVRLTNREPNGLGNMTLYTIENIEDSPLSFTASFHPVSDPAQGVEEVDLRITAGSQTLQGTHLVVLKATREGAPDNYAILHVIVECRPPFFLSKPGHQPESQTVDRGSRATLQAVPGGDGPLHYQWYRGPSGTTTFPVTGANGATFMTEPVTTRTPYWVRVSNACGSKDSKTVYVTPAN